MILYNEKFLRNSQHAVSCEDSLCSCLRNDDGNTSKYGVALYSLSHYSFQIFLKSLLLHYYSFAVLVYVCAKKRTNGIICVFALLLVPRGITNEEAQARDTPSSPPCCCCCCYCYSRKCFCWRYYEYPTSLCSRPCSSSFSSAYSSS